MSKNRIIGSQFNETLVATTSADEMFGLGEQDTFYFTYTDNGTSKDDTINNGDVIGDYELEETIAIEGVNLERGDIVLGQSKDGESYLEIDLDADGFRETQIGLGDSFEFVDISLSTRGNTTYIFLQEEASDFGDDDLIIKNEIEKENYLKYADSGEKPTFLDDPSNDLVFTPGEFDFL
ncbi:MAG: hypothetical protein JJ979_01320 [Roseibium sp.]|nr:hypothetical protein [Roseibium sp.]